MSCQCYQYSCTRQIARITHNCQLEVSDTQSVRIRTDGISRVLTADTGKEASLTNTVLHSAQRRVTIGSSRQISCPWDRAVSTFVSPPRTEMSSFRRRRHIMLVSSSSGFFPVALETTGADRIRICVPCCLQITLSLTHLGHPGRTHRHAHTAARVGQVSSGALGKTPNWPCSHRASAASLSP